MYLQNCRVCLTIDDQTGAIAGLTDRQSGFEYCDGAPGDPFLAAADGETQPAPYRFSGQSAADGLTLCWEIENARLSAEVTLLPDGVRFRATLQNGEAGQFKAVEYPIFGSLRDFGPNGYLAHAYATGVLLRDPLAYLPESGALRYAPYPESFSGASMQFFTYYEQGRGGLYFAALDGDGHQKWLNAYRRGDRLVASHMFGFENAVPGAAVAMTYDFVVRFTAGNGWQEAAALYKPWAWRQKWCARGKARDRKERAGWLLSEVGACTFGVNAGHDRTPWLRRYREDLGAPVFHVLGPDWTNEPQTFYCGVPGDLCDWLPTKFNRENLDVIRENGDYFAPFEFDFLVSLEKSNPDTLRPHLMRFPSPTFSHDAYTFHMLCPADPFTKAFHRERDLAVLREAGVDAMYYDISCNNLLKVCLSDSHGHKPGGGAEITDAYLDTFADTQKALSDEAGKYIPLGTEMMNETCLGHLDFYQARAWGQPSSTLETYPFRDQMRDGRARMIPMFDFVYHEMGVVRMDGWGKLVSETGGYFFHVVARVYLWGGLYEINHEYSPMEALDGRENAPEEHYFPFDPQHNAYAPDRAAYVRQFARARVGAANRYLAFGAMVETPALAIPEVFADWYHYNHGQKDPSYKARGSLAVPAVVASAYEDGAGGFALFLANADTDPHTLQFTLPGGLAPEAGDGGARRARLVTGFDQPDGLMTTDLGVYTPGEAKVVNVELSPLRLYMLEIR